MSITLDIEDGTYESSSCEICMEPKSSEEFFQNHNCHHMFCYDCISKHVSSKIDDSTTRVRCPHVSCKSLLEPEQCRSILSTVVFERWIGYLSESAIPVSQKLYCPYRDCSGILIDESVECGEVTRKYECPYCKRLFCAKCKVPWHSGFECEEFQKLNKKDLSFLKLAEDRNWKKCPNCKYFVEKSTGCYHITCRCGVKFCYGCGAVFTLNHICIYQRYSDLALFAVILLGFIILFILVVWLIWMICRDYL